MEEVLEGVWWLPAWLLWISLAVRCRNVLQRCLWQGLGAGGAREGRISVCVWDMKLQHPCTLLGLSWLLPLPVLMATLSLGSRIKALLWGNPGTLLVLLNHQLEGHWGDCQVPGRNFRTSSACLVTAASGDFEVQWFLNLFTAPLQFSLPQWHFSWQGPWILTCSPSCSVPFLPSPSSERNTHYSLCKILSQIIFL